MSNEDLVELVARAIYPYWFVTFKSDHFGDGEIDVCALDNYPLQHRHYQESARKHAKAAIDAARPIIERGARNAALEEAASAVEAHLFGEVSAEIRALKST